MYVDNNTTYNNNFTKWLRQPPTMDSVASRLTHDAQTWERCLWTSGGLLKLPKCLYYIMKWKFTPEGEPILTEAKDLPQISLTSGDRGTKIQIAQYDCSTSHKTLGNQMNPALDMHQAQLQLITTSTNYATRLMSSNLTQHDTWRSYFTIFIPRMIYTFPISLHSMKFFEQIQSRPTRATLAKWDPNATQHMQSHTDPVHMEELVYISFLLNKE